MTELKNKKIYNYFNNNVLQIEEVINTYTNYVEKIIKNTYIVLPNEDVEEIILDVFLTVWRNQQKLDINKNMSSYIGGITKNLIKKKYNKNKIIEDIEDYKELCIDLSNIELICLKNEEMEFFKQELEKLKQEDKEIFVMYYYEDKSIKEISIIFGMSEGKIKSKLFRIRKRFRKIFKERGEL